MNILVVDDNNSIRQVVSAMISACNHVAIAVNGHEQAMAMLAQGKIDLILMDVEMPIMDGFDLTKLIRATYQEWIPIIFLSSNDSEAHLSKGIDAGGDDYLTKPVKEVILVAKIRAMERLALMKKQLDQANERLQILSSVDPLTQVLNRRGLDSYLNTQWATNLRERSEFSLLMIDIDFFKPYNDHYGHPKGDDCLRRVASLLAQTINRTTDIVARYGGEEFIIVLPFTPLEGARHMATELLLALKRASFMHEFSTVAAYVTISIGISSTAMGASSPLELIEQADHALYQSKERGRNTATVYHK